MERFNLQVEATISRTSAKLVHIKKKTKTTYKKHSIAQSAGRTPKPQCPKSTIPRRGPPPREPKKVDYKRPAMTKSMAQRLKHSQKLQEDMERKERERVQAAAARRPRRTAAPMGGDARMGREKSRADVGFLEFLFLFYEAFRGGVDVFFVDKGNYFTDRMVDNANRSMI